MKNILLIFLPVFFVFTVNAQSANNTNNTCDVFQYSYRFGKPAGRGLHVKRIILNNKGNIIKQFELNKSGKVRNYIVFEYNNLDVIKKETLFNAEGNPVEITEHFIDNKGKEETEKTFNRGGILIDKTEYIYNENEDWVERKRYSPQGLYSRTLVEKFTDKGKRLSGKVYGKDGVLEYNFEIKGHDKFGNETEKLLYKPDGTLFSSYKEMYNENNKIILKSYEGKYKIVYEYNNESQLVSEIHYDINTNDPQFLYKYIYK